jgi:cell division protein FtsQ
MRSLIRRRGTGRLADPAPSRWAWRIERLMLTPLFTFFLRVGLPVLLIAAAGVWWLHDETRRAAIHQTFVEARAAFESRPEFMVRLMSIDGAEDALAQLIREEVAVDFPVSSFDLDLPEIRSRILTLAPVEKATVRIRPGGVLQVDVTPRVPVAIWRNRKGLTLVDATGAHVAEIAQRMDRPDLPLFAGAGANAHVEEALALHRAAAPLGARLRGVVRIGARRWDVVLDRDQRILLPEQGAVQALERVIALDGAKDILGRDVARVDLRLGDRPTVRMSEYAAAEWWALQQASGLQ